MSDYGTMQARIADEASAGGLMPQIRNEIQDAIKHYETNRFAFNQGHLEFLTVGEQTAYGVADHADIPNIARFDSMIVSGDGWGYSMAPIDYQEIMPSLERLGGTIPRVYAYRDYQIHLGSTPLAGYVMKVAYLKRLLALAADTDTNAWMVEGESLIRNRSKRNLFYNVLRQYDDGDRMRLLETEAYDDLRAARRQLVDAGTARLDEVSRQAGRGGRYNIYGDVR